MPQEILREFDPVKAKNADIPRTAARGSLHYIEDF